MKKETLIQLVMNLSSFYRSSLSNGKMHISIGQELEISRAYLEILQIRYFHKFDFTITCPEALKKLQLHQTAASADSGKQYLPWDQGT